jgi:hypothetical protein
MNPYCMAAPLASPEHGERKNLQFSAKWTALGADRPTAARCHRRFAGRFGVRWPRTPGFQGLDPKKSGPATCRKPAIIDQKPGRRNGERRSLRDRPPRGPIAGVAWKRPLRWPARNMANGKTSVSPLNGRRPVYTGSLSTAGSLGASAAGVGGGGSAVDGAGAAGWGRYTG